MQKRKLTELKNIGKKIAGCLKEVGIFSEPMVPVDGARRITTVI